MKYKKDEIMLILKNIVSVIHLILFIVSAVALFVYQVINPNYIKILEIIKCLPIIILPAKNLFSCIYNKFAKNIDNFNFICLMVIFIIQALFCILAVSFPINILSGKLILLNDAININCESHWLLSKFFSVIPIIVYYAISFISQIVEIISQICFIFANKSNKNS